MTENTAALVRAAHNEIADLCSGAKAWRMSIPADEARDSDLILSRALDTLEAERDDALARLAGRD